jgi:SNF2 family DNA or RNA helicase
MTIRALREPDLSPKLRGFPYQAQALAATKDLEYAAILHEQGLGKTKIGIDLALYWISSAVVDSVLIVTKRGLIQNWVDELRLHSHVEPRILTQDRRANFLAFNSPARIYLTHYEVLKSELTRMQLFLRTRRVGVILDESHKIKTPGSEITRTLFTLSPGFVRRVIMTGTPVANRPYDLWSQIYFLDAGESLGRDFEAFRTTFDLTNDMASDTAMTDEFERNLGTVFSKIRRFAVRETKKGADIQLPEKRISMVSVEMELKQAEIYEQYRREFASIVVRNGVPVLDDADEILKRLLRLVQVASNPRLVDDSYHGVPGKLPVLCNLVYSIVDRDEKVIIWTNFTKNVDWFAKEFRQYSAVRVHGKMAYEDRQKSINSFKLNPDCRVLVATPASAKEGLTLTVANNAIFFDRSFSLDDYLQAQDRIHRISQKKDCSVVNLLAANSIDDWVELLLSAKGLAAQLAQGDITREEYRNSADYAFGEMIKQILGCDEAGTHD